MRNRTPHLGGKQTKYNRVSYQNRHGIWETREEQDMIQKPKIELTSNYYRLLMNFLFMVRDTLSLATLKLANKKAGL